MIRLDGHQTIAPPLRDGVIALGNFDGFHAGHQAVAARAVRRARAEGRPCLIATFDPHPVHFFKRNVSPFRLTSLDQREAMFGAAGADAMLVLPFDDRLANTRAEDFITELLLQSFGAAGVVTGTDFIFGKGRGGSVAMLVDYAQRLDFYTETVAPICDSTNNFGNNFGNNFTNDSGAVVSSSRIRTALQEGDCATATTLLTRPFAIEGYVQHGDKQGRLLGFPTANLDMADYLRPRYGVYAVTGHCADGRTLRGVANLGVRPQFTPAKELLEPHFFDFSEDLYGQKITVEFHAFLRDEARFESQETLIAQMARDCLEARDRLCALLS